MTKPIRFQTALWQPEGTTGYAIRIPVDPREAFGKARAPVKVTINGHTFRSTVASRFGAALVVVNKANREACGVEPSRRFEVSVALDAEPRVIDPPADLARALKASGPAAAAWDALSYTHRKEHVQHVEEAKRPETRARRIAKTVEALAKKKTANTKTANTKAAKKKAAKKKAAKKKTANKKAANKKAAKKRR